MDITQSKATSFLSETDEEGEYKTFDCLTKSEKRAKLVLHRDYI